jgi:BirA family transcriptional regulator, biotin operon repressor / biotin---[acetyl-CoA-carboxylase] ligase
MEGPNATSSREWPPPWRVQIVAVTGSTNTDLLAAGQAGAPHGTVLVADHQTAGRGRLDRTWDAPPGANLLVSLLFRAVAGDVEIAPQAATQRVAVAAARACEIVAGVRPVLKWPNDLLLDERKLAGVLAQGGQGPEFVVVGLGLNVGWAPEGGARLPSGSRDDVLAAILQALNELPADVSAEHRARLGTLGQEVRVELPGGSFNGVAVDLDRAGRLVVETGSGRRVVDAGDVVHIRPAAP